MRRVRQWLPALAAPALLSTLAQSAATAQDLKVPRFVSLKHDKVHMRAGPGFRYPIQWVYKRQNLPVEVLYDYEHWRLIRDPWGTRGWIHSRNLSGQRTVLITERIRILRAKPDPQAAAVARAEPAVIGKLESCGPVWCRIAVAGHAGWLRRAALWGLYPNEKVE